jgi:DNA-binding MarR family transcriptional regulator
VSSGYSKRYSVAEAMHSAAIRLLRMVRVEDARSGVGPAQLSALSVLVFQGEKTLRELALLEQVQPPTMSRIVDGLVRQNLATRVIGATDRRSISIAATSKGRKLLLAGRTRRVRALEKKFESFTDAEIEVLRSAAELLTRL